MLTNLMRCAFLVSYSTIERASTVYLFDFVTFEGDRFYVSADLRSGKIKLERVSHPAFERFILKVISMGEDRTTPSGRKEVSA